MKLRLLFALLISLGLYLQASTITFSNEEERGCSEDDFSIESIVEENSTEPSCG